MKIYTKTGDDGSTGLFGNARVPKDHPRIEAYGTVDELNAALGMILSSLPGSAHAARGWLETIQADLFVLGSLLATPSSSKSPVTVLSPSRVEALEHQIDQMEKELKPLKNFILPQGTLCASTTHLARAISRRAERRIVSLAAQEPLDALLIIYTNRLSDFLFVLARWINQKEGGTETAWINPAGSGQGPQPDKLSASLQKLEDEKKRRQSLFEKTAQDLQKKKESAAKNFQESVEQIKKDGGKVEPTVRPIDLD